MNDPDRWRTSDGFDHDAIFADIVAHLNDDVADPDGAAGTLAEDAPTDTEVPGEAAHSADRPPVEDAEAESEAPSAAPGEEAPWTVNQPPGLPSPDDPPAIPTPQVWRAHEVDDDYEEHFEPLPMAPLPVGDLQFWAIIAGMGGGPLLLLYLAFFNREADSYWMASAIAMSVGGFALLVMRLPRHHEDDDDGARL